jgi:hypothetical protein
MEAMATEADFGRVQHLPAPAQAAFTGGFGGVSRGEACHREPLT